MYLFPFSLLSRSPVLSFSSVQLKICMRVDTNYATRKRELFWNESTFFSPIIYTYRKMYSLFPQINFDTRQNRISVLLLLCYFLQLLWCVYYETIGSVSSSWFSILRSAENSKWPLMCGCVRVCECVYVCLSKKAVLKVLPHARLLEFKIDSSVWRNNPSSINMLTVIYLSRTRNRFN